MEKGRSLTGIPASEVEDWLSLMMEAAGLDERGRRPLARQMVEADLLGHHTHGAALLKMYLQRLANGQMNTASQRTLIASRPAVQAWDLNGSVGAWALDELTPWLLDAVETFGQSALTLARSSHIGNLQAHMLPFVEKGLLVLLSTTTPSVRSVAPPGGTVAVTTTNPIAFGAPTRGLPILVDTTTSIASNNYFRTLASKGLQAPDDWLRDPHGNPTTDPNTLAQSPPGSIETLGAPDAAHKGFALGLMSEVFALALSGWGRVRASDRSCSSVYLTIIDPAAFGGEGVFLDEVDALVRSIHASNGQDSSVTPRVPGERAMLARKHQMTNGIEFPAHIWESMSSLSADYGIKFPWPD